MESKSEADASKSSCSTAVKEAEGEKGKKVSLAKQSTTIQEEKQTSGEVNLRSKEAPEGTGVEGSWRKPYNKSTDRRKSTDFSSSLGAQHSGDKKHNNKPRHHNDSHHHRQKSFDHTANDQPNVNQTAKDRRNSYNRSGSYKNYSTNSTSEQKGEGNNRQQGQTSNRRNSNANKSRSMSIPQQQAQEGETNEAENGKKRITRGSTTSNGKGRIGSHSINSNGESFDYDDMELDEPFSDSDDESPRQAQKPCLIIPRGRIRTLSGTVPPVGNSPKWGGPTMCLSCLQFFNLPEQIGKFADHLLQEHHIVVEEMELIVDPKRYVEHWRQRFAKEPVDKLFPKKVPKEGEPLFGKVDYYFEMSERIPEDYGLRQRLAMRRLEEALGCQQREREEVNFSMQCIFCRYVARGNRAKIIHHLYMIHHLNLGSPDNLVFVGEYIDHLKEKLQRNECIYCEKTFSDRTVLMDHMRKRNHREVNPKNNYYDKFYIINYLELGKRWLDVLAEDFEDTMPTFVDSDDEEEEESWHEWQEDNTDEDQLRAVCLYCEQSSEKIEDLVEHIKHTHSFDLLDFIEKEKLDVYGRMKFLNFVRKQTYNTPNFRARSRNSGSTAETTKEEVGSESGESKKSSAQSPSAVVVPERQQWDTEENLVPMFGNDHFPWMLESFLESKSEGNNAGEVQPAAVRKSKSVSETGEVDPQQVEVVVKGCLEDSKNNTIEGVVAEDWPELGDSVLADQDMYKSLR